MNTTTGRWPALLLLLAALFVLFSWWSLDQAISSGLAVDSGYQAHGQHQPQTADWQVEPRLDGRQLTVRITDAQARPILGCRAELLLPTGKGLPLLDIGQGHYQAEVPALATGTVNAGLRLIREDVSLHRHLTLALPR